MPLEDARPQPEEGRDVSSSAALETVSLAGDEGYVVARNIAGLMTGRVALKDLSSAYYLTENGTLGLIVDADTFSKLPVSGKLRRPPR